MSNEESTAPVSAVNRKVEVPGWLALVVAAAVAWGALKNQVTFLGGQAETSSAAAAANAATSNTTAISNAATLSRLEEQVLNLRVGIADVREAVGSLDREQASRFEAIEARLLAEEAARQALTIQLERLATRVELLVTGQIGVSRGNP